METKKEKNMSQDTKSQILSISKNCKTIAKEILESNYFDKEDKYHMMAVCCANFISEIGRELFPVFNKRDVKNILDDVLTVFDSNNQIGD